MDCRTYTMSIAREGDAWGWRVIVSRRDGHTTAVVNGDGKHGYDTEAAAYEAAVRWLATGRRS